MDEAALAVVVAELTALCNQPVTPANTRRRKALVTKQRALTKAVDLYHLHLRQYAKQRAKAQQVEADLVPGEGVLYRASTTTTRPAPGCATCSWCWWSARCRAARWC